MRLKKSFSCATRQLARLGAASTTLVSGLPRESPVHARTLPAQHAPRLARRTACARNPNAACHAEGSQEEKKPHKQVGQGSPPSQSLYPRNPKPAAKQGSRKKQARRGRGSLACAMRPYRASLASLACLARAPPLRSTSCVVARPPKRLPATASSAGCARARRVLGSLARAPA